MSLSPLKTSKIIFAPTSGSSAPILRIICGEPFNSVARNPGQTPKTFILYWSSSRAKQAKSMLSAALLVRYPITDSWEKGSVGSFRALIDPSTDVTKISRADNEFLSRGKKASVTRADPNRLVEIHSSRFSVRDEAWLDTPALLIMISSFP